MTNRKPVMPSENNSPHSLPSGLPRTKHVTIRLPIDLLTEAQRQAAQDSRGQGASVTDWIVQLIEQTLHPQSQAMVTSAEAALLREADYNANPNANPDPDYGTEGRTSLMIAAGRDSGLGALDLETGTATVGTDLGDAGLTDAGSNLRLGDPVDMAEVQAYVSGYVQDYVSEYVSDYVRDSNQPQLESRLERFNEELHQHRENFTVLQDTLQTQVKTLQEQLNYCLGE
ncbi:MAG: hypothetical protein ACK456_05315 [Pseudanabaenaceae cyanobacterium]